MHTHSEEWGWVGNVQEIIVFMFFSPEIWVMFQAVMLY